MFVPRRPLSRVEGYERSLLSQLSLKSFGGQATLRTGVVRLLLKVSRPGPRENSAVPLHFFPRLLSTNFFNEARPLCSVVSCDTALPCPVYKNHRYKRADFPALLLPLPWSAAMSCPTCVAKVKPESPPFYSDDFYKPGTGNAVSQLTAEQRGMQELKKLVESKRGKK